MRQIVNSVAALFQNEARSRGLHLKVEMPLRLPRLALDGERIQQVLINLIGNAIKFTDDGGTISVGVRQRGEEAFEVWVSDTGVGIPAEEQSRIFEEFTRIDRDTRQKGQGRGAGLGLAIARRIVEAHGGAIAVSSAPGQGSTFTFSLPMVRQKAIESAMTA